MSYAGRLRRRRSEIKKNRARRAKIQKLKLKYKSAKSEGDRKTILDKIWKMSHLYPVAQVTGQKS